MITRDDLRMIIAKEYGRHAFGWGADEPNRATGYLLRQEAADFADDLVEALAEQGLCVWAVVK